MAGTMKEIAYICGVSRGTVDRVLNKRGKVKQKTAEHILSVAQSIGYIPVSGLQKVKPVITPAVTRKIGVLVNAMGHEYFGHVTAGMLKALERLAPYNITGVVKLSGGFDVDQQLRLIDELVAQGISGLAITPANSPRVAARLKELTSSGIPVVIVSSLIENFDYFAFVGCEHYLSGRIAGGFARKILPNGGRIAILTGLYVMPGLKRRIAGFIDALSSSPMPYDILEPVQGCDDDLISYKGITNLIARNPGIDLFFLGAGGYSGAYQALSDTGLLGKVKIIAFDLADVNVLQVRAGNVSALFNQHPASQGRHAIKLLSDYLQFHTIPATRENYERVEILIDESFYTPNEDSTFHESAEHAQA